jgi:lactate 2-monooxygenase
MPLSASERQRQIYLNGLSGTRPSVNVDAQKLEENAKGYMSPRAFAYIAGGAGVESTMRTNRDDLERIKIVPRMLRDVDQRDTSIELFGKKTFFTLSFGAARSS